MKVETAVGASQGAVGHVPATSIPLSLTNLRLRNIVTPFDFSDPSTALLRRVVTLAEHLEATVHIVHVVEPRWAPVDGDASTIQIYPGARAAAARMQIEQWVSQTFCDSVSITTTIRVGRAADEILTHAQALSADLVVMSAHVGSGPKNVLLRTITERVVQFSPCPVLVIPRNQVAGVPDDWLRFPFQEWKRILLPTDLSNATRKALKYTTAIVRENRAKLHILHCSSSEAGVAIAATEERVAAWLGSELRETVDYEATLWSDIPLLNAILQEAKRSSIDLIVLPSGDNSWLRRHRLASTTNGILRHAPCPILCLNASLLSPVENPTDPVTKD